jgi:hypothetical protein
MPSRVDQVADANGAELVRLSKLYPFPDFVKQANFEQVMAARPSTASSIFADPVRRQYPCDTAASTWLSAVYFYEKKAEFHPKDQAMIEKRIDQFVDYWRIKAAVDGVRSRWKELHKTADEQLPDHAFALVWVGENGAKERRYRLSNTMEVKVAAEYVGQYRDRLPFEVRHKMATRILEKAQQYGAALGKHAEFLERQAGRGVCDPAEVVAMIQKRAAFAPNQAVKDGILKLAASIKASARQAFQPGTMVKLAETVDKIDRGLGLTGRYADGLVPPEDVIFKTTFGKAASDLAETVATTTGKIYEKKAFARVPVDDLQALFGREFVDRVRTPLGDIDVEKMAEEVSALPRPDASMLDGLLSENGIVPVLTKAASTRQGFAPQALSDWAAAYRQTEQLARR